VTGPMRRVLVTDGEERAALAVVRSLGRAGHDPIVCAARQSSLAGSSRYCRLRIAVPDPLRWPDQFGEAIEQAIDEHRADVVIPVSEAALMALLPRRERLAAVLPFASQKSFEQICNKALVLEKARELGIAVPKQIVIASPTQLHMLRDLDIRLPIVIKPARSVVTMGRRREKTSVMHVQDHSALTRAAGSLPDAAYPLLVQERIVGQGAGVFMLLWGGDVVAAFSHRRLREKPPAGGVSVYRESRPLDPHLLSQSTALLAAFEWQGVAMVEYKLDEQSGRAYLMEINGRFWGSLQLAIDAGVDFPSLLVDLAGGYRPPAVQSYRCDVRTRWLMGDVDHLVTRMRRTRAALDLPADAPGRGRALVQFLTAFGPGSRNEILRLSDPVPAVHELLNWAHRR
jgi:predicted ATP-grasp superfamily ATP-dependent carboligase